MPRPSSKHPTELELAILKILWRDGALSGREIRDVLAGDRELSYQSVMTMLGIMEDKGYVRRKKSGGSFAYSARVTEKATSKRMLRDVVDRVFDGSAGAAMVHLLESSDIDADDLQRLRDFVQQHDQDSPGGSA